jgi:hypothetical protein
MHRLDDLIDRWVATLTEAEPALKPHSDEIADHVRTDAQARVEAGADMSDAFAAAIGSFGAPRELAREFLRSEWNEDRLALRLVAWYLAVVLLITVGFVAIDKLVVPLPTTAFALAWLFILNPLLMLPFVFRFFRARRKLRAP